jgi:hypothetical protein
VQSKLRVCIAYKLSLLRIPGLAVAFGVIDYALTYSK